MNLSSTSFIGAKWNRLVKNDYEME